MALANFFIQKSKDENVVLDPLKLQKLLYYAYGWYLAIKDKQLFAEKIGAWRYGPVIQNIYREFASFGSNQITDFGTEFNGNQFIAPSVQDAEVSEFLKQIWDTHKGLSGIELSNATHESGAPWDLARKAGRPYLDDEDMKSYFRSKMNPAQ